jgi:hypothetical protein
MQCTYDYTQLCSVYKEKYENIQITRIQNLRRSLITTS